MKTTTPSHWLGLGPLTGVLLAAACASSDADQNNGGTQPPPSGPESAQPTSVRPYDGVVLQLGNDLAPALQARVKEHIASKIGTAAAALQVVGPEEDLHGITNGGQVIAIGETSVTRELVPDAERNALRAEGYAIKTGVAFGNNGGHAIAVRGSPAVPTKGTTESPNGSSRATAFGAYAVLEELGFGFLHPLAPTAPEGLALPIGHQATTTTRTEEPRWPIRGLQLHTMHPLELTNVLQGWGISSPQDEAGFQAMLPDWEKFLEWMIANGQNSVHWVLLEADGWSSFAMSELRRQRLTELVSRAHAFGITVGVDVPLVLRQQNTFRLITPSGDIVKERAELTRRVDWLLSAGFDYLATENGTTELTHVDATRMLGWMNDLTKHVAAQHGGKPTYIKLHCSTGQTAKDFIDPATGKPINYNYLPHFADSRLGVMPHTVQYYGLDDPAPTYGNEDFGYVRDFLRREVGRREVVWHPETAYWVSFDVDVPLFLPIYAERRVHDLRLLGGDEDAGRMGEGIHAGKRMDGQNTFSSGWEWGYWLNDVVTARASWNPHLEQPTDDAALGVILDSVLRPFGQARAAVRDLLIKTARIEHEILLEGRVGGAGPASTIRKNGQAYLQGFETWDDVSDLGSRMQGLTPVTMTQPARIGLVDMRSPVRVGQPRYTGEVEPLLAEMESRLAALLVEWNALRPNVPHAALDLYDDMVDAMHVTVLRARQIHGLFDYVDQRNDPNPALRMSRLAAARAALDEAAIVVKAREPRYRVPADRIAGWSTNPTAYHFGYLWSVRSLYYWWRDEGLAVDAPKSPCYLNVLSMTDVGLGEGSYGAPANILRAILDNPASGGDTAECLAAPTTPPSFPQFGLRTRP